MSITEDFTWALVFPGFALKNASDLVYDLLDEVLYYFASWGLFLSIKTRTQ